MSLTQFPGAPTHHAAARLLRVAAALVAVQGAAHTTLFLRARPRHGAIEVAVVEMMKAHRFLFSGFSRSYWDFYYGYGLEAAAVCFVEAVLFWQLARIATERATLVLPIVALFVVATIGHAILILRFFFVVPVLFDIALAACLAWAFVAARSRPFASSPRPAEMRTV